MKRRKYAFLATTALVGSMAMGACNNDGVLAPQEFGMFGLPVGEPIEIISATRGDGVAFDKFTVTFNNADGTDVTVTTPEGEEINFTEADLEWSGSDPDLGGVQIAKLTSSRGDRLDVTLGSARVPVPPPPVENGIEALTVNGPETEDVDVVALGRLDEADTRHGFETYGVVGQLTDPGALPRYQEDVIVNPGTEGEFEAAAGELAYGSAWYHGGFLASIFKQGEVMTDDVSGDSWVQIDFAGNDVDVWLEGEYVYDDVDDVMQGNTVTGIVKHWGSFVASVDPSYALALTGFDTTTGTFVTGITATDAQALTGFSTTSGTFVTAVNPTGTHIVDLEAVVGYIGPCPFCIPLVGVIDTDVVVAVNPATGTAITTVTPDPTGTFLTGLNPPSTGDAIVDITTDDGLFVTAVNAEYQDALTNVHANMVTDTDNVYHVSLSGSGDAGDLGFDGGVHYTGELSGEVEIPETTSVWVNDVEVAGEFAGAVYGPGSDAETVDPANPYEVVDATATAGVFEANSGMDDGDDPQVEIVGGFIAEADDASFNNFEPAPPPDPDPQPLQ